LRKITYLMLKYFSWGSRDSSGLRAWLSLVRVPAWAGNFSLHRVQTGSGARARESFPADKAAGAWSWPLHLVPRSRMRGVFP
jgi:hypothetical protein